MIPILHTHPLPTCACNWKTYKILSVVTWVIGFSSLYCIFKIICIYYILFYKEKTINVIRKNLIFLAKVPLHGLCYSFIQRSASTQGYSIFQTRVGMILVIFTLLSFRIIFQKLSFSSLMVSCGCGLRKQISLQPESISFFGVYLKGNSAYETRVC